LEASALHAPSRLSRFPLGAQLLRLRSDDQLVALFRAGSDEAFGVLHDRYRQRLFAYVRQMLSGQSRQDAEDVLQDVFVRAFGALRGDSRAINVRAWLYRVAHNRCIDHLRRPHPPAAEIFEMSRKPLLDPVDEAQRREDLKRLVSDVGRLPEQQRSALLMREIDGLSYADLAGALDVTVPAVKSLLVRARVGLVEAQESRDADCGEIQRDLMASYDRGVKASGRARRHMRECAGCRDYRDDLRGMRRRFAALAPAGAGPLALIAQLLGGGGAAAAGGSGGADLLGGAPPVTA
jgi:RNA polymerase sigma factor (sigma-70 family)